MQRLAVRVAVELVASGAGIVLRRLVEHRRIGRDRIGIVERRLVELGDRGLLGGCGARLAHEVRIEVGVQVEEVIGRALGALRPALQVEILQVAQRIGHRARRAGEQLRVGVELLGVAFDRVGIELARNGDLRQAALRQRRREGRSQDGKQQDGKQRERRQKHAASRHGSPLSAQRRRLRPPAEHMRLSGTGGSRFKRGAHAFPPFGRDLARFPRARARRAAGRGHQRERHGRRTAGAIPCDRAIKARRRPGIGIARDRRMAPRFLAHGAEADAIPLRRGSAAAAFSQGETRCRGSIR